MQPEHDESALYWLHVDLGAHEFKRLVHAGRIRFAGNLKLKIYGALSCVSGKRMKTGTRIFFSSQQAACDAGFRPCGHCLRKEYLRWKLKSLRLSH